MSIKKECKCIYVERCFDSLRRYGLFNNSRMYPKLQNKAYFILKQELPIMQGIFIIEFYFFNII